jgi:hypothetical protein
VSKRGYEPMLDVDPKSWRVHRVLAQPYTDAGVTVGGSIGVFEGPLTQIGDDVYGDAIDNGYRINDTFEYLVLTARDPSFSVRDTNNTILGPRKIQLELKLLF